MGFDGFANGFARATGFIVDKIVFWQNWDLFSQLFLFGIIAFCVITFIWIKSEVMRQANMFNKPRKFRSRKHF